MVEPAGLALNPHPLPDIVAPFWFRPVCAEVRCGGPGFRKRQAGLAG